ncbi:hypothetical protein COU76_05815 [Candidatus Peregrinibacteria bacterium CG10_big_fil_rev_8_21_14_0_10_49_10]|nr:MAG: hypothetical protein COU76_05815 [Candidatus Peregrinibacteria bacterium CG10_big_fil_rev_8_21_14_0_10_49_10]
MDLSRLQKLIDRSHILTEAERTYWTQSLPKMNEMQQERLEQILTKAKQIPWTEQVQKYFASIAQTARGVVSKR